MTPPCCSRTLTIRVTSRSRSFLGTCRIQDCQRDLNTRSHRLRRSQKRGELMQSARKPWWQQATAIVSLGAGGAVTGLSFVPRASAEVKSPSNMLIRLLAQEKPAQPAPADDATLRSAIVNVANYY